VPDAPARATDTLTPDQRAAVEHDAGPLIVLAGPGTGKTRVIIHRVAHLIEARGVDPASIVAVTYTTKAARQLRERLAALVGHDAADRVNASTFHAFGLRLLRRFGDRLGLPANIDLVDVAQSRRLLTELILTNDLFPRSRGRGVEALVERLECAFGEVTNFGLLPMDCERFAAAWLARVGADGAPAPSPPVADPAAALDPAALEAERFEQRDFADIGRAYGLYAQACADRGWITFNDLILLPIRLLREHPSVRAICRNEHRAFIVDEFQDCNPAQIELLRAIAGPDGQGGGPEICVVGDDDQAIYAFRGADERAFDRFDRYWPGAKVVALGANYRSEPPIIAVGNAVIARSASRFRPDKTIAFPDGKERREPSGVEGVLLENDFQDGETIAAMILADREADALAGRPPRPFSAYAVICRTHGDLDRIANVLGLEAIPFDRQRERSILDDEGVQDVLAWIEWLVNPRATWAAQRILIRPPFGLPRERVLRWPIEYAAERSRFEAQDPDAADPGGFADWLAQRPSPPKALARALAMHATLAGAVGSLRGDEAVYKIVTDTDPAHAELLPGRQRARRVAALLALIALARGKQRRLAPPADLAAFHAYYLDLGDDAGKPVGGDHLDDAVDGVPADEDDPSGRVQLLTAHAAKGLEFDTVFVPRVSSRHGYPGDHRPKDWTAPDGLFDRLDARSEQERHKDEERRLFYVACTRAERRLVLMSKQMKSASKALHFFQELTRGRTPELPIRVRVGSDVLKEAAALGIGALARSPVEAAAADPKAKARAAELIDRVRRHARLEAALALESVDRPDADETDLAAAAERLKDAAERLRLVAGIERAGAAPAFLTGPDRPELAALAARLAAALTTDDAHDLAGPSSLLIRPLTAPLRLSFSAIRDYKQCPLCYYLSRVRGLPAPDSRASSVGQLAHGILKTFYDDWARADSDGRPRPDVADLLRLGRTLFFRSLESDQGVVRSQLDQLMAQLRTCHESMHDPEAHILETERALRFRYALDGTHHDFTATVDRVDLLPEGGVLLIDYKTGHATKRLLEPAKDDLQLAIYAMALAHTQPDAGPDAGHDAGHNTGHDAGDPVTPTGFAEYWCLSTGQKGRISLATLDQDKVRAVIDDAARGMLAGAFRRTPDCDGPCCLFDD